MFNRIGLRYQIFLLLGIITLLNLSGSIVTLSYTYRTQALYTSMVDRDVNTLMAAQKLETALIMQKGFTTYYFLTNASEWLERLNEHHENFQSWLKKARNLTSIEGAHSILNEIESRYIHYIYSRDRVIGLYKQGRKDAGAKQHWEVRNQFFTIYNLCEEYKRIHEKNIAQTREQYKESAYIVTLLAWGAIPCVAFLGFLLAFILLKQILEPIRKLTLETNSPQKPIKIGDEVKALRHQVYSLIKNVDQAKSKLEESREHLIQSEKLAMVGKLAAGFAHSVRNPLTSVKMRLFSLERSLKLTPVQNEDFEVISEEIRHIDTIVKNFLEFSRPPKLRFQLISPSDVVDMTLQLLKHRIESYGTDVQVQREQKLPEIQVDAEQLKEVLVNLLLNACEAIGDGGSIQIREAKERMTQLGDAVIIQVKDDGPGIPRSVQDKLFEPFFSNKEEGTGLGLSIAKHIIEKHGGVLDLKSQEGEGATFVIALPYKENTNWLTS